MDRVARQGRVPDGAQVPFNAACEPSVPQGKVCKLDNWVVKEEVATGIQIEQRPQPPTVLKKKCRSKAIVFEYGGRSLPFQKDPTVVVLQQVGQEASYVSVAEIASEIPGQPVSRYLRAVEISRLAERW
jgi:hypothetical protein